MAGSSVQGQRTVGFVEATTDAGHAWRRIFERPNRVFDSMAFANAKDGWALTMSNRTVYQTRDGGRAWSRIAQFKATAMDLTLSPGGTPWLVLTSGSTSTSEVVRLEHGVFSLAWKPPGQVIALSMDGSHVTAEVTAVSRHGRTFALYTAARANLVWRRVSTMVQYPASVDVMSSNSPISGTLTWTSSHTALASVFAVATCANGCGIAETLVTHNGGASWHALSTVNIACQFGPLIARRDTAIAVEDSIQTSTCGWPATRLFVSSDQGVKFTQPAGWPESGAVGLGFASPTSLWASTGSGLMMSFDKGQVWTQVFPQPIPTGTLTYASPHVLYASGDQTNANAILKSTDQGRNWHIVTSLNGVQVSSLAFPTVRDGWAIGLRVANQGQTLLLHTTDGGHHWTVVQSALPGAGGSTIVRFFSAKSGEFLNLGGSCSEFCRYYGAVTYDGGKHWTAESARRVPSCMIAGAILAPREALGAVCSEPGSPVHVYETRNNGQNWPRRFTVPRNWDSGLSFSFPTAQVGYLSVMAQRLPTRRGAPTPSPNFALLSTADGGRQWQLHRLFGLTAAPFSSVSIYFGTRRDGMLHCNNAWWRTTDGGRIWTEILS